MKKTIILTISFVFIKAYSQIGIGVENPHPSSALEVSSSSKGILIPRLSKTQLSSIINPSHGLFLFQKDSSRGFLFYDSLENDFKSVLTLNNGSVYVGSKINSWGNNNVVVGSYSFLKNSNGSYNTAVGSSNLPNNTKGNYNLALGFGSLLFNTTGSDNIALGYIALRNNTTGKGNIGIGTIAGYSGGNYNISIGYQANYANPGNNNISIGNSANNVGSSNYSISIGDYTKTEFDSSIAIGSNAFTEKPRQAVIGDTFLTELKTHGKIVSNGINRAFRYGHVSSGSHTYLSLKDDVIMFEDGAWSGSHNVILPDPIKAGSGRIFTIILYCGGSSNSCSLNIEATNGTINNLTTFSELNQDMETATFISDGKSKYYTIDNNY